jgi:hypothetical protein
MNQSHESKSLEMNASDVSSQAMHRSHAEAFDLRPQGFMMKIKTTCCDMQQTKAGADLMP